MSSGVKISELTAASTFTGSEVLPVVQSSTTLKGTVDQITTYVAAATATLLNKTLSGTFNTFTNIPLTSAVTGTLPVANGGTGVATYATGDLLYATATTTLAKLAATATTFVLLSGTAPSWGKVALASAVSGTLPVANGGTAATSAQAAAESLASAYSVEDLTALKALTSRPLVVAVKSGLAAGDWQWVAGSSTTADDVLVVQCSSGTAGRYKRIYSGPIHSKWCAVGDGSTDDTTALNTFFAFAAAGYPVHIDKATYKITSGLTAISADKITITGDGRGAIIKYVNAGATTPTIMTFGDGSTTYSRATITGFTLESGTTLTGGYGIRVRKFAHVDFDVWAGDEYGEGWKLYDAVWFDTTSIVNLHSSHFYGSHKCLVWSAGVELHCQNAFVKGYSSDVTAANATGTGIHIGGGCGGFYGEGLTQIMNDIGLLVDTSITSTANVQVFLGSATFDTNKTAAVRLNDGLGTGLWFRGDTGWMASSNSVGLDVVLWNNGRIDLSAAAVTNNGSHGISIATASPTIIVPSSCNIRDNAGYGIYASTAATVYMTAKLINNTSGTWNGNVTAVTPFDVAILNGTTLPAAVTGSSLTSVGTLTSLSTSGTITSSRAPASGWMIDGDSCTLTVANSSNAALAAGSGLILCTNPADGSFGVYFAGGGNVSMIANTGTWVTPTTTPAAGKACIQYDGAGAYRLYNNYGSSQAFKVVMIRTRASI